MNNDIEKAIESFKLRSELNHDINARKTAISALENQLNNSWIPVSIRLPTKEECNKNDTFLVTVKYENFSGIYITTTMAKFDNGKWDMQGVQPVIMNKKITAWCKPEPYMEVEK